MKEILLMAVDLGTSFIKAGVYNTESQCIAIEMEPVKDYRPKPGVFYSERRRTSCIGNCVHEKSRRKNR